MQTINRIPDIAQLLVSCWLLGTNDKYLPTSHGLLDEALERAAQDGQLPEWALNNLHFVDSRVGRRCLELSEILSWAQQAELTSDPNPSYRRTQIQLSDRGAKRLLERLGWTEESAAALGKVLRAHAEKAKEYLVPFSSLEQ
jgi:hypothetical protein